MNHPRKPVIRSPLDRLPLHQKQALLGWLTTGGKDQVGITYREARQRLVEEFGVKASKAAIHYFFHRHRCPTVTSSVVTTANETQIKIVIQLQLQR